MRAATGLLTSKVWAKNQPAPPFSICACPIRAVSRRAIYEKIRIDIYEDIRRQSPDMVTRSDKKPTEAELAILRVLWARGPSTVREVARAMGRESAYTTILKLMQIM